MKRADFIKLAGATVGAPKEPYGDKDMVIEVDQELPSHRITIPFASDGGTGFDSITVPIIKDSTGKRIAVISHNKLIEMGCA